MENVICGKQQPDDLEVQRKGTERNTGQRGTVRPHFEHAFCFSLTNVTISSDARGGRDNKGISNWVHLS